MNVHSLSNAVLMMPVSLNSGPGSAFNVSPPPRANLGTRLSAKLCFAPGMMNLKRGCDFRCGDDVKDWGWFSVGYKKTSLAAHNFACVVECGGAPPLLRENRESPSGPRLRRRSKSGGTPPHSTTWPSF